MGVKKQKLNKGGAKKIEAPKDKKIEKPVLGEVDGSELSNEESEEEENEESELENLDDLDMDDEVDVADVSSDEEDSNDESEEGESEEGSDDEIPKLKKKKNTDDGSEKFANAFTAIINSKLKKYDRKDPILARNKAPLKKLESDKLEAKAKRMLHLEKKSLHDEHRVKNLLPSASEPEKVREILTKEKQLKKIAQKGVVRLFNAVLATQVSTDEAISQEKVGESRKEELMNEISKEKFLDLVQAAGE